MPGYEEDSILERDAWQDIIQSDGWKVFKTLLQAHKRSLEKQVVISVKAKRWEQAADYESRADECQKILTLVENRLAEIKGGK